MQLFFFNLLFKSKSGIFIFPQGPVVYLLDPLTSLAWDHL